MTIIYNSVHYLRINTAADWCTVKLATWFKYTCVYNRLLYCTVVFVQRLCFNYEIWTLYRLVSWREHL